MKDTVLFQVEDNYPIYFDDLNELPLYTFAAFPATIYVHFSDESLTDYIRDTIDNIYEYYRSKIKWLFANMPQELVEVLMRESLKEYDGGKEGSFAYETNKFLMHGGVTKRLREFAKTQEEMPKWAQDVIDEQFWDLQ